MNEYLTQAALMEEEFIFAHSSKYSVHGLWLSLLWMYGETEHHGAWRTWQRQFTEQTRSREKIGDWRPGITFTVFITPASHHLVIFLSIPESLTSAREESSRI